MLSIATSSEREPAKKLWIIRNHSVRACRISPVEDPAISWVGDHPIS